MPQNPILDNQGPRIMLSGCHQELNGLVAPWMQPGAPFALVQRLWAELCYSIPARSSLKSFIPEPLKDVFKEPRAPKP